MTQSYPILGTGTTIAAGTSNWFANVFYESIEMTIGGRPVVRTTKLNATAPTGTKGGGHTSKPGLLHDPIQVKCRVQWDPANRPPINAAAETWTITWPDGTTTVFSGYIAKAITVAASVDGLVEADVEIEGTGVES